MRLKVTWCLASNDERMLTSVMRTTAVSDRCQPPLQRGGLCSPQSVKCPLSRPDSFAFTQTAVYLPLLYPLFVVPARCETMSQRERNNESTTAVAPTWHSSSIFIFCFPKSSCRGVHSCRTRTAAVVHSSAVQQQENYTVFTMYYSCAAVLYVQQ